MRHQDAKYAGTVGLYGIRRETKTAGITPAASDGLPRLGLNQRHSALCQDALCQDEAYTLVDFMLWDMEMEDDGSLEKIMRL